MDKTNKNTFLWGFYNKESGQEKPATIRDYGIQITAAIVLTLGFYTLLKVYPLNTGGTRIISGAIETAGTSQQSLPVIAISFALILFFLYALLSDVITGLNR